MKIYKLYFSNESDFSEVFELKKFIKKNNLERIIARFPYVKGSDAIRQMSYFTSTFSTQLAEQDIVLPLKLRYVLLVIEDTSDARNVKFVMGRSDIESYLQTNLL